MLSNQVLASDRIPNAATYLLDGRALTLLGQGRVRNALADRLARDGRAELPGAEVHNSLVIAVADTVESAGLLWSRCRELGAAWLPVHAELDRVVIGPLTRPGRPGCARCLDRRRAGARPEPGAETELDLRHGERIARTVSALLGPHAADTAATLALREATAWAAGAAAATDGAAVMLELATLRVSVHRFLPDPECPFCGAVPDDAPEAAVVAPRSRLKPDAASVRARNLIAMERTMLEQYVDSETGVIVDVRPTAQFPFPTVSARLQPGGPARGEEGYGRTTDFQSARLTGIAEALERLAGVRPGGKRTVVRGTYRELYDRALDPRTLGLYPPERYAIEDFPYEQYHDDLELPWVWAYSFGSGRPLLVPEQIAYYRVNHSHGSGPAASTPFVYEISNGCALGSCLEEAIIHGLVEVAERDAFLMTWFARMPVPRLDPATADDPRIELVLERIAHRTGYQPFVFTNTLEQRVPSFWVMAVDPSGDPDRPKVVCAGGSALDAERGVLNALQELATCLEWRLLTYPRDRARAERLVHDATAVRRMDDHGLLYSHPDAFDRFEFLLKSAPPHSFAEFRQTWHWPRHADLRQDLNEILARYLGAGLDVLVVDQTRPEHRAAGFACVKVIVPGTLPMTFGHDARRVDGLRRLLEVPHQLGYRDRPLTQADINPHPHPFP